MSDESWAAEVLDVLAGSRWYVMRAWRETTSRTHCVELVHSTGAALVVRLADAQFPGPAERASELRRRLAFFDAEQSSPPRQRIVRTWFREHDNGWRTIVDERRDGTFHAGAESPVFTGSVRASRTNHETFEAAAAAAESDVVRAGHRCSDACGNWQMVVTPP